LRDVEDALESFPNPAVPVSDAVVELGCPMLDATLQLLPNPKVSVSCVHAQLDAALFDLDGDSSMGNQPTLSDLFHGMGLIMAETPRGIKDRAVECLGYAFDFGGLPPINRRDSGDDLIEPWLSHCSILVVR
jgi:hypothetical protein